MATDDSHSQSHNQNQNQNQSQSQKLNRNCKTDSITELTNLIKGWTKCWLAKICHRCRKPETSNSCCLLWLLLLVVVTPGARTLFVLPPIPSISSSPKYPTLSTGRVIFCSRHFHIVFLHVLFFCTRNDCRFNVPEIQPRVKHAKYM